MYIWNAFWLAVKKRRRYMLGQPTGCRAWQNVGVKEGSVLSVIWDIAMRKIANYGCWAHQTDFARKLKCSKHTCHWHGNMQRNDWYENMQGKDWHENMQGKFFWDYLVILGLQVLNVFHHGSHDLLVTCGFCVCKCLSSCCSGCTS